MAAPSAHAAAPVPVTRIAGANRFGTAAAVAAKAFPAGANTVLIATGFNFPDALAGNYLAGLDKAPILLVNVDNVPSETSAALQSLKAKNVVILGQTQAVSANVESQLRSSGYNVSRIGGATRYDTMQLIDEVSGASLTPPAAGTTLTGTTGANGAPVGTINGKKTALLARGDNFPDALGGGPVAYAKNFPVILTSPAALSPQAQAVIKDDGIQQIIILGGQVAIPTAVEQQANAAGAATLYRANGVDRSDTSRMLAEYAIANLGFTTASYAIASGDQYFTGADALASGPFSGGIPQPTLVTNSVNDPGTLVQFGQAHNATATTCYAIGGPVPLPDATVNAVCNATPASNQTFTATPSGAQSSNTGTTAQNVSYSFANVPAGTAVTIQLFNCNNVQQPASGPTTFTGSNPGGSGNVAQPGTLPAGVGITVVNGASQPTTTATAVNTTSPASGPLTFTVSAPAGTTGCVVPVVFTNTDADGTLQLGTNNQPTEQFGSAGPLTFFKAAPAGTTAFPGAAVSSPTSTQFTTPAGTYTYGPNDVYQLVVSGSCTTSTYAEFQRRLSSGDQVSGTYNPPPTGPGSTFCLNDIAPAAPTVVTTSAPTGTNAGQAGVQVNFSDSATGTAASYNVYRATATQPAITGQSVTCPALPSAGSTASPQTPPAAGSAYQKIGSVTDANLNDAGGTTPAAATYSFLDSTATVPPTATPGNPSYCYAVTTVDQSGQEGSPSAVAGPATASAATPAAGAPKFAAAASNTVTPNTAGTVGAPNTVTVTYNQPILCSTVDANGSDYTVVVNNGATNFAQTVTGAACNPMGTTGTTVTITFNGTAIGATGNGQTVTVTAKNGTDTNTVSNNATPAQFQPVGDAVQVTV